MLFKSKEPSQNYYIKATQALYDRQLLCMLVYGFIRDIEENYRIKGLNRSQTIPNALKNLCVDFTDLFNECCEIIDMHKQVMI